MERLIDIAITIWMITGGVLSLWIMSLFMLESMTDVFESRNKKGAKR